MTRHLMRLLLSAALVAAGMEPAAYANAKPARDTAVSCARADNQYCRLSDAEVRDGMAPRGAAEQALHA